MNKTQEHEISQIIRLYTEKSIPCGQIKKSTLNKIMKDINTKKDND